MKLSEVITAYGDDKVEVQYLDRCATNLNYSAKTGTKVTFGTPVRIGPDGLEKFGIIVWMDRDQLDAVIEKEKDVD